MNKVLYSTQIKTLRVNKAKCPMQKVVAPGLLPRSGTNQVFSKALDDTREHQHNEWHLHCIRDVKTTDLPKLHNIETK